MSTATPTAGSRIHEGKVAIVTGGARSIGAAIASNLAEKGASILISYLTTGSDAQASALATDLSSKHNIIAVPCRADISTPEGVATLISTCQDKFPPNKKTNKLQIDIIINCAAIMPTGPVELVTPDEFHRTYAVNVLGPILLVGAAKPFLPTDRSGRIVNISSIGQKTGLAYLTLYNGTKGALEAMTRTWARELAEQATVNTVNPGSVMTDMFRNCSEDVLAAQALWSPLIPLTGAREWDTDEMKAVAKKWGGRPAYVEEIAGIVAIVCNPESAWMTGSVVSANGGQCFST
ncbi:hypothetical protein BLS_000450 [Venturia inaequalis]|uniref:Uncharacterized protein n=1 Tax=Venturia inaequalis TaxID=5025 RepID=A0A8H3YP21_VENIN|nr:hypothetical protein BLS_000450 [Venturia inaequalis]KAE9968035.1 hypothetical protein EG328_007811 [Venturia inaequalis]KAE9990905.1 hypothetical protein EG327_000786 [Venturia inaequalis]RDI86833.1 hypothetical protein Vi05172_g3142 [Venturia inaequalis]